MPTVILFRGLVMQHEENGKEKKNAENFGSLLVQCEVGCEVSSV